MKKLLMILGLGLILSACDRSSENQPSESAKNSELPIAVEKIEGVEGQGKVAFSKESGAQSQNSEEQSADKKTDLAIAAANKAEVSEVRKVAVKSEGMESESEAGKEKVKPSAVQDEAASTAQSPKQAKVVRKSDKQAKAKKRNRADGSNKRISNLSEEELRVGAQEVLTKDEIQYFKGKCRYALMSEQDIIDNRCEAKRVSVAK